MTQNIIGSLLEVQKRSIESARLACIDKFSISVLSNRTSPVFSSTLNSWMCPPFWDTILCWPATPANSIASISCPTYVAGFDKTMNNATRICTENATWFFNEEYNDYWTNYTECFESQRPTIVVKVNGTQPSRLIESYFPVLKTISKTGYTVSFCTLIVAFIIMLSFKKLHCPRNKLHMHLFASFILRAFFFLLKDLIFIEGIGLASDLKHENGSSVFVINPETNNWVCKFVTSLWEYFITANYSWILMEGLYLYNLIFRALFADSNRNIIHYIILGWGLPLAIVIPWVVIRILMEDTLCWTTHDNSWTFLIIRIPTTISICLNLVLFINISIVLYSKLRSPVNEETQRYQKWAKSTLVLVPLFGIHYAIFLIMWYSINKSDVVEVIWLIGDQLFASFQGFFVAILYCFLNGEVKAELKPHIHRFLTYCATSSCIKYCFPFRQQYLSSARARSSVCTTMSCSSLYTNGISHRNNRARWDVFPKVKKSINLDKNNDHVCHLNACSWHCLSSRKHQKTQKCDCNTLTEINPMCSFSSIGSVRLQETSLCLKQNPQTRSRSDSHLLEEKIQMIPENMCIKN